MISEGRKRGLSYNRIAELVAKNPAERFGMAGKGNLVPGYDADFVLVDDAVSYVVHAQDALSAQEYTPFEGFEMTAAVTETYLRGSAVSAKARSWVNRGDSSLRDPASEPKNPPGPSP